MTASGKHPLACTVVSMVAMALSLFIVGTAFAAQARLTPEDIMFYRSVYVLQSLSTEAGRESVTIPRKVVRADETESLYNHPDKILVLRRIAEDLSKVSEDFSQARYFEACAWIALGEPRKAADLLIRHLSDALFSEPKYMLACNNLYAVHDYITLYIICLEWEQRDPTCSKQRWMYMWKALFALERYEQARDLLARQSSCMGWEAAIYSARASVALGHADDAETAIAALKTAHPANQEQIQLLWDQVQARTVF